MPTLLEYLKKAIFFARSFFKPQYEAEAAKWGEADHSVMRPTDDKDRADASETTADNVITEHPDQSEQRRQARLILHPLFEARFEEFGRELMTFPAGQTLSHAGHIQSLDAMENRPTFFSRLPSDHLFYLKRQPNAGILHVQNTNPLILANLGGLDMASSQIMNRFNSALPSACSVFEGWEQQHALNDFELNKNLAFQEWAIEKEKTEGFKIDGWWREGSKDEEAEEILIIAPQDILRVQSWETEEEYKARCN